MELFTTSLLIIDQNINTPDGYAIFTVLGVLLVIIVFTVFYYNKNSKLNFQKNKKYLLLKITRTKIKGEFKLTVKNKSNSFVEVNAPELTLKSFRFTKKMIARSNNYPLTITPGTQHSIIFNKEKLISTGASKIDLFLFKIKINDTYRNIYETRYRLF